MHNAGVAGMDSEEWYPTTLGTVSGSVGVYKSLIGIPGQAAGCRWYLALRMDQHGGSRSMHLVRDPSLGSESSQDDQTESNSSCGERNWVIAPEGS